MHPFLQYWHIQSRNMRFCDWKTSPRCFLNQHSDRYWCIIRVCYVRADWFKLLALPITVWVWAGFLLWFIGKRDYFRSSSNVCIDFTLQITCKVYAYFMELLFSRQLLRRLLHKVRIIWIANFVLKFRKLTVSLYR